MERVMTTPAEYEQQVADHFGALGYRTTVTTYSNDYGLDVLAENGSERIAVQAKLYGHTSRQVNRQMIMELHGVRDYFDCDRAVLATDGTVRADAQEVASKLGITILPLAPQAMPAIDVVDSTSDSRHKAAGVRGRLTADEIWTRHVFPLAGRTLHARGTRTNRILTVDWGGIERITSNGTRSRIDYEIFRATIDHILQHGLITRDEINQNYAKRASSGIVLILSQVPGIRLERNPIRLVLEREPS